MLLVLGLQANGGLSGGGGGRIALHTGNYEFHGSVSVTGGYRGLKSAGHGTSGKTASQKNSSFNQ